MSRPPFAVAEGHQIITAELHRNSGNPECVIHIVRAVGLSTGATDVPVIRGKCRKPFLTKKIRSCDNRRIKGDVGVRDGIHKAVVPPEFRSVIIRM